jgi:monoamine oxidase
MSWDVAEGAGRGEWPPFFEPADVADAERIEAACVALAATVDADDPWSHPDSAALDSLSVAAWLRAQRARPAVIGCTSWGRWGSRAARPSGSRCSACCA